MESKKRVSAHKKVHQKEPMCDHRFFLFAADICFQVALKIRNEKKQAS
jgi:hypothetical protein